jgi:hypothetical protein
MHHARRMGWWLAVPVGIALGLALAIGLDRAAEPAAGQGGRSGVTVSAEQLRINQRISQAAVKRSNRANSRLDQLKPAGTGPAGPAGAAGPAGPAGPGAARVAYSAAVGTSTRTVLELAGVTIGVACEAGAGGETNLVISAGITEPTTFSGTSSDDGGTDPNNPDPATLGNFQGELPVGPSNQLGGPSAPDGAFSRAQANVLFITPTRTVNLRVAAIADGAADRCSFNGVAVPA